MDDEARLDRIAEESADLYPALSSVLDQETANRLFPNAWRHLQRIRAGPMKKRHVRLPELTDRPPAR